MNQYKTDIALSKINDTYVFRFLERIILESPDKCWGFVSCKDRDGYGFMSVSRVLIRSHRLAWCIFNEKTIPHGMVVMHKCDNPSCVNPQHLDIGTPLDNTADMVNKGRNCKPPKLKFCKRGHPRSPENLGGSNGRSCKECMKIHFKSFYEKTRKGKRRSERSLPPCVYKVDNRFMVQFTINGKNVYVGSYKNIEDAISSRDKFKKSISLNL